MQRRLAGSVSYRTVRCDHMSLVPQRPLKENVWNNWCVRPELYNWVVASFNSPWVKAYFDVGNHVKYAGILRGDVVEIAYPPELWICTFGPRQCDCEPKPENDFQDRRKYRRSGRPQ